MADGDVLSRPSPRAMDTSVESIVMHAIAGLKSGEAIEQTLDIHVVDDATVTCDAERVTEALRHVIVTVMHSAARSTRRWVYVRAGNDGDDSVITVETRQGEGLEPNESRPRDPADGAAFDEAIRALLAESARVEVTRGTNVGLSIRLSFRRAT